MKLHVKVNGIDFDVEVEHVDDGRGQTRNTPTIAAPAPVPVPAPSAAPSSYAVSTPPPAPTASLPVSGGLVSPVAGSVQEVRCRVGDQVKTGDTVLVVEAMKMQTSIPSDRNGTVAKINISKGDSIREGQILIVFA